MALSVDHALFAWTDREAISSACDAVGLGTTFGGVHDGGETQNDLVAFPDGSYLEFMTPTDAGTEPDRWAGIVDDWCGPEHWCIRADVRTLLRQAIAGGAPVEGPAAGRRDRPDGTTVEWVTGQYGPVALRGALPFAIGDRTPRQYRVPQPAVVEGPLDGIATVCLGVESEPELMASFRRLHDFPTPVSLETSLAAGVRSVPGQPVALVDTESGSSLADRPADLPAGPVAFLLATADFEAASRRYDLTAAADWGGRRLAWFDAEPLRHAVGVVEVDYAGIVES